MKIGCPNCGQHYDVEAGSIDHFFRCTECGELFRGINAKPVKLRKVRRRSKSKNATAAAGSVAEPGASAAVVSEAVPVAVPAPEEAAPPAPEPEKNDGGSDGAPAAGKEEPAGEEASAGDEAPAGAEAGAMGAWRTVWRRGASRSTMEKALAAAVLALVFAVILLWSFYSREAAARRQAASGFAAIARQQGALDRLQQDFVGQREMLHRLENAVAALEQDLRQMRSAAGGSELTERFSRMETRLDALEPKQGAADAEALESCKNRIASLESRLKESAAAQSALQQQTADDWRRLIGVARKRDSRTVLERIALLESVTMNNLSASERPERLPRYPIVVRLTALENLLTGSEDVNLAQRYPGGVMGQLEAIRGEINKLKWALGK